MAGFLLDNFTYIVAVIGIIAIFFIFRFGTNRAQWSGISIIFIGAIPFLYNILLISEGLETSIASWMLFTVSTILGLMMLYLGSKENKQR